MRTPDDILKQIMSWAEKVMPISDADVFISELCFFDRKRRADLTFANGLLSGFEIKSEADTLARWSGQQADYLQCFDKVWLCVHVKHILKALEITQKNVGIIAVDNDYGMVVVRDAQLNNQVNSFHLTGFLWRVELDSLAKENNISIKSRMRLKEVREILSQELPLDTIRQKVLSTLKNRYSSSKLSASLRE